MVDALALVCITLLCVFRIINPASGSVYQFKNRPKGNYLHIAVVADTCILQPHKLMLRLGCF